MDEPRNVDLNEKAPPPSYDEIAFSGSSSQLPAYSQEPSYTPGQPTLTYIDFTPDGPSFKYPDLIDKANLWLASNRAFRLHSCETVVASMKDGEVCREDSVTHVPARNGRMGKDYSYVLRCWLLNTTVPTEHAQVIGTKAYLPDRKKNIVTVSFTTPYLRAPNVAMMIPDGPTFKPLSSCVEKINEDLKENPLPGRILKIETGKYKIMEGLSAHVNLDPDVLHWTEGESHILYGFYFRLFYIMGEPVEEQIGWKDIVPSYKFNPSNVRRPQFEPFSQMLHKAGIWAHPQQDKRITNIQTLDIPMMLDPIFPHSASRPFIDTNKSDLLSCVTPFSSSDMNVNFLRVFYVQSADLQLAKPYCLTQRPFLPYRLTPKTYESVAANVGRLSAWIGFNEYNSIFTENDILCAETVKVETQLHSLKPLDVERTGYVHHTMRGFDNVAGIRLYINGNYQEPPLEMIGIPPAVYFPPTSSGCCSII